MAGDRSVFRMRGLTPSPLFSAPVDFTFKAFSFSLGMFKCLKKTIC